MYETILKIINSEIREIGVLKNIEIELINQLNKIRTRKSIYVLLNSINDVNRVGLI